MPGHLAVCGVGACLAMVGHFPHRPRLWVPHVLGLAAMLLAWLPGAAPVGTLAALLGLAAVLAWQVRAGTAGHARWPGITDTVAMAALIGLMAVEPGTASMHHSAADGTLPYAVAVLVVWALVRRAVRPVARPDAGSPDRSGRVLGVLRFGGGLVMLTAMTAMLA